MMKKLFILGIALCCMGSLFAKVKTYKPETFNSRRPIIVKSDSSGNVCYLIKDLTTGQYQFQLSKKDKKGTPINIDGLKDSNSADGSYTHYFAYTKFFEKGIVTLSIYTEIYNNSTNTTTGMVQWKQYSFTKDTLTELGTTNILNKNDITNTGLYGDNKFLYQVTNTQTTDGNGNISYSYSLYLNKIAKLQQVGDTITGSGRLTIPWYFDNHNFLILQINKKDTNGNDFSTYQYFNSSTIKKIGEVKGSATVGITFNHIYEKVMVFDIENKTTNGSSFAYRLFSLKNFTPLGEDIPAGNNDFLGDKYIVTGITDNTGLTTYTHYIYSSKITKYELFSEEDVVDYAADSSGTVCFVERILNDTTGDYIKSQITFFKKGTEFGSCELTGITENDSVSIARLDKGVATLLVSNDTTDTAYFIQYKGYKKEAKELGKTKEFTTEFTTVWWTPILFDFFNKGKSLYVLEMTSGSDYTLYCYKTSKLKEVAHKSGTGAPRVNVLENYKVILLTDDGVTYDHKYTLFNSTNLTKLKELEVDWLGAMDRIIYTRKKTGTPSAPWTFTTYKASSKDLKKIKEIGYNGSYEKKGKAIIFDVGEKNVYLKYKVYTFKSLKYLGETNSHTQLQQIDIKNILIYTPIYNGDGSLKSITFELSTW